MTRTGWVIAGLFVLLAVAGFAMLGGEGPAVSPFPARPMESGAPTVAAEDDDAAVRRIIGANGLVVPVAGVAVDALSDSWGDARDGGARGHTGIDIMAPRGTPVLAAAAGRLEKLFTSDAGGLTAYVRSPSGRISYYYAHLDGYAPDLREGMAIRAGQPIGTVGDSGNAEPGNTHLHFGITAMQPGDGWSDGRAVNPYPLLAGAGAGG